MFENTTLATHGVLISMTDRDISQVSLQTILAQSLTSAAVLSTEYDPSQQNKSAYHKSYLRALHTECSVRWPGVATHSPTRLTHKKFTLNMRPKPMSQLRYNDKSGPVPRKRCGILDNYLSYRVMGGGSRYSATIHMIVSRGYYSTILGPGTIRGERGALYRVPPTTACSIA